MRTFAFCHIHNLHQLFPETLKRSNRTKGTDRFFFWLKYKLIPAALSPELCVSNERVTVIDTCLTVHSSDRLITAATFISDSQQAAGV